ncbi:DotU family type IV/VI secretion system protein [Granulicella sp. dw_53]|uniref:DotU family type IV/VI secretion system protein n=1 Tax=Granulicella sp. dw_53 TaxID=2719792 RepID=UPI001BD4DFAD|nr:DotU family type IV/VI secretion system protein [Granulicella sp. dw_53]
MEKQKTSASVNSSAVAPPSAWSSATTPTIASLFSEALTAILRVRYGKQTVGDAQVFRDHMRRLLQSAMQEARSLGYSSPHIQMSVLATVGFLDESVLNLANAAPADWARRPMQEELFGGHIAGETFFQNFSTLLREENSAEVADVLELHCHCLMLGYKGRYAFGNTGELAQLLRAAQEKIARIRGGSGTLLPNPATLPSPTLTGRDRWSRRLMITAVVLAAVVLVFFISFALLLRTGATRIAQDEIKDHAPQNVTQCSPAASVRVEWRG